jgi:SRSO17 transposase
MNVSALEASEARFEAYVQALISVIGHKDRAGPLRGYCKGLLVATGRKSVEPMAAVTAPARTSPQHQSLLHFVGNAAWSDAAILGQVRELILPAMEKHGPIEAWILDDTGYPKKGKHSVGVARQYCGQLGKQDNCQTAVSISAASHYASLPIGYRLYLPKEWADDEARRKKAGVPGDVTFKTKPEIALDLVKQALKDNIPRGVVLGDAGYGADAGFRDALTELGLPYAMGIGSGASIWAPGTEPLPPISAQVARRAVARRCNSSSTPCGSAAMQEWSGKGRPPQRLRRNEEHRPVTVKALALTLEESDWQIISWREGTDKPLKSRFARLRVRPAHEDFRLNEPRPEEWLVIEWPQGEEEPTKYWFSTLDAGIGFEKLIDTIKLRWRIERDYQELKQELGLGHYEGRGWRGFHHHATLCIAAYGFLISERETVPPSPASPARRLEKTAIPEGYRPRGSPHPHPAPHARLDRHHA